MGHPSRSYSHATPFVVLDRSVGRLLLFLCQHRAAQTPSNILVIIADDLGVDQVGVYGEGTSPAPTPIIDGLASSGVLFRNAWANPTCSPTRSCIMTGRYGYRTGVGQVGVRLDLAETSLPELLGRGCIGIQPRLDWQVAPGRKWGRNQRRESYRHGLVALSLACSSASPGTRPTSTGSAPENGQTAVNTKLRDDPESR